MQQAVLQAACVYPGRRLDSGTAVPLDTSTTLHTLSGLTPALPHMQLMSLARSRVMMQPPRHSRGGSWYFHPRVVQKQDNDTDVSKAGHSQHDNGAGHHWPGRTPSLTGGHCHSTLTFFSVGRLIHTSLGSQSLVAHVLHYPPPPHTNIFVIGTVVINTHDTSQNGVHETRSGLGRGHGH